MNHMEALNQDYRCQIVQLEQTIRQANQVLFQQNIVLNAALDFCEDPGTARHASFEMCNYLYIMQEHTEALKKEIDRLNDTLRHFLPLRVVEKSDYERLIRFKSQEWE